MRLAIMQPYFMPYIGYFQLINSVDQFIIYDKIQYTKKGWINRNRILLNGRDQLITLPIKKDSDYLDIVDRELSESWGKDREKMLNVIQAAYRKAPHFQEVFKLLTNCLNNPEPNLFRFIHQSILLVNDYLEIKTPIILSSTIDVDSALKSQNKVLSLCKRQEANVYINPIGGVELYSRDVFWQNKIELKFIKSAPIEYRQFGDEFIAWLSIIDVMMFNSKEQIKTYLNNYTLI